MRARRYGSRDRSQRSATILLIDDSASVREVLRLALESEDYRVIEAADGREGVSMHREHRTAFMLVYILIRERDWIDDPV